MKSKDFWNAVLFIGLFFILLLLGIILKFSANNADQMIFFMGVGFVIIIIFVEFVGHKYKNAPDSKNEEPSVLKITDKTYSKSLETINYKGNYYIDNSQLINGIIEAYPTFNIDSFLSTLKVNFDKLTNKSIPLDKTLEMIATDDFINKYSNDMKFAKEVEADYISKSGNIEIIDYDEEKKQILVSWSYKTKLYEYNNKTGEVIKGLTRIMGRQKQFWVIRADNVKHTSDYVHCPNCGAPLKYALDLKCNQCSSTFDYCNYWLLNDLIKEKNNANSNR